MYAAVCCAAGLLLGTQSHTQTFEHVRTEYACTQTACSTSNMYRARPSSLKHSTAMRGPSSYPVVMQPEPGFIFLPLLLVLSRNIVRSSGPHVAVTWLKWQLPRQLRTQILPSSGSWPGSNVQCWVLLTGLIGKYQERWLMESAITAVMPPVLQLGMQTQMLTDTHYSALLN